MAEGILKSLLSQRGINDIHVSSAGIGALSGMPATPFAIEAARHWNVDISGHRARQLTRQIVEDSDLILAMSQEHVETVLQKSETAAARTFLIKAFPAAYSSSQQAVQDPIGGYLENYNQTYLELDEIIRKIEGKVIEMAGSLKRDP
jgi:protein-tyrosine-phosphatase